MPHPQACERTPPESHPSMDQRGKDLGSSVKFPNRGFKRNTLPTLLRIPNGRRWSSKRPPRSSWYKCYLQARKVLLSPRYLYSKSPQEGLWCPLVCSNEIGPFLINQTIQMGASDMLGEFFSFLSNNDNAFFPLIECLSPMCLHGHFTTP